MRESALAALHARQNPRWTEVNGMRLPGAFTPEGDVGELALIDLSCFTKTGLKGPRAAAWLAGQRIAVPPRPNSWSGLAASGLIARLADTEFLLEDGFAPGAAASIAGLIATAPPQVYGVPRHDAALALAGRRVNEVLLQTCSVNFASLDAAQGALALTSMAGVPVLVIPQTHNGQPLLRIWLDPSFAPYLWQTLLGIVQEQGGRPAGLASLFPQHPI
jgi:glycine cleavage system aminomethyltransferase T